ncbi:TIGR00725 family protein [Pseudoalteromonas sp. NEC-BIFX-2020_002]|uniref:TIGR00725 family protein n=1 Tax=Pseudoalteromonas sp. NEC-BIFX-2020_002 TaxID=2732353 RepID=UPI001476945D|nr:TIGR00725 family protein [Pseudoalteromonas sp. NEC-BIFX-2020_002]NNG43325.1 TIGR00725 family protein [Pseudoalteromonas sp. NEC-BIFX-2020_002]
MSFPQVSVIGNAKIKSSQLQDMAEAVGLIINDLGFHLVCGGLGGVMEASCKGHKSGAEPSQTIGILPSFKENTANKYTDIIIPSGLDVGRNQLIVSSGFAVVVLGGGAGTLSEIALASQINKPILLMKGSGGWADILTDEYLDQRCNSKLYHISSLDELRITLQKLSLHESKSGSVDSGHNR